MNNPEMEKLRTAVNLYINDIKINGKAETTLIGYKNKLDVFCRWFGDSEYAEQAPTATAIMAFKEHLASTGRSAYTISQYLTIIHTFFEWACDPAMPVNYKINPVSKKLIPKVKQNSRPYEDFLTKEDVAKILNMPHQGTNKRANLPRNYAIMVMFITTGLRSSELRTLTLNSIDFEMNRILVVGKGDKFRVVALPPVAVKALKDYLDSGYRPEDLQETDWLFGSIRGDQWTQMSATAVYRVVENFVQGATGTALSPHKLRHVYSRTLLQAGAPLEEIQSMLGHSNSRTTQIYTGRLLLPTEDSTAFKVFADLAAAGE